SHSLHLATETQYAAVARAPYAPVRNMPTRCETACENHTPETLVNLLTILGASAAALLALGALARGLWRINRRIVVIVSAVQELAPNGGRSIKDTVTRTERKVDEAVAKVEENTQELCELKRRFEEHLNGSA